MNGIFNNRAFRWTITSTRSPGGRPWPTTTRVPTTTRFGCDPSVLPFWRQECTPVAALNRVSYWLGTQEPELLQIPHHQGQGIKTQADAPAAAAGLLVIIRLFVRG